MLTWQVALVLMFLALLGGFLLALGLGVAARATAYQAGYRQAQRDWLRRWVRPPAEQGWVPTMSQWEREED